MKTIVVVGASKGIGNAIAEALLPYNEVINISRSTPVLTNDNLIHYSCDILNVICQISQISMVLYIILVV